MIDKSLVANLAKSTANINEKSEELVVSVPLEKLIPNENNFYDETYQLDDLINSIESVGQIDPLIITSDYKIISGHRRFNALKASKLDNALCIIRTFDSEVDEDIALVNANKQRKKTKDELESEIKKLDELYKMKKSIDPTFAGNINQIIADELDVSVSTVKRAKKDKESGKVTPKKKTKKQLVKQVEKLTEDIENSEIDYNIETEVNELLLRLNSLLNNNDED